MQEQDRSDTCFYVSPALKCKFVFRTSHSSRVFEGIPVAPFHRISLETINLPSCPEPYARVRRLVEEVRVVNGAQLRCIHRAGQRAAAF